VRLSGTDRDARRSWSATWPYPRGVASASIAANAKKSMAHRQASRRWTLSGYHLDEPTKACPRNVVAVAVNVHVNERNGHEASHVSGPALGPSNVSAHELPAGRIVDSRSEATSHTVHRLVSSMRLLGALI